MENKVTIKFRKTMTSMGYLKSGKYFDFGFTKEQIETGRKRDYTDPLLIYDNGSVVGLYSTDGQLRVKYFISYYGLDEGLGKHGLAKKGDNYVKCTCHQIFQDKIRKKALDYFQEHLKEIEDIREGKHG